MGKNKGRRKERTEIAKMTSLMAKLENKLRAEEAEKKKSGKKEVAKNA